MEKFEELEPYDLRDLITNHSEYYQTDVVDNKFTIRSTVVEDWLNRKRCVIVIDNASNDKMLLTPFELSMDGVSDNVFKRSYNGGKFATLTFDWIPDHLAQHSTPNFEWSVALLRRFHWSFFNPLKDYLMTGEFIALNKKMNVEARKTTTVYPPKEQVYRAFSTRADVVRVVFISLDPYNSTHANGNAFATDQISKPVSLRQIEKAIQRELNYEESWQIQNNLENMIKQGCLFLNSSLTISAGSASGQNLNEWRPFMNKVIELLNTFNPLIFILIGKAGQSYETVIDTNKHFVYKLEHPSYSTRQERDWNSNDIFKKINEKLESLNTPILKW